MASSGQPVRALALRALIKEATGQVRDTHRHTLPALSPGRPESRAELAWLTAELPHQPEDGRAWDLLVIL